MIFFILGRFQTPQLHQGHQELIDFCMSIDNNAQFHWIISVAESPTEINPLSYSDVVRAIQFALPDKSMQFSSIADQPTNWVWCSSLKGLIQSELKSDQTDWIITGDVRMFPDEIYDAFDQSRLRPIDTHTQQSSYEIRKTIWESDWNQLYGNLDAESRKLAHSAWTSGKIWNEWHRYSNSVQTVDGVLYNKTHIVLCRKSTDIANGNIYWRLPGGFVDSDDESLESAIQRECKEELGLSDLIVDWQYFASFRQNDWRFKGTRSQVMVAAFCGMLDESQMNGLVAGDDIHEIMPVRINRVVESILFPKNSDLFLIKEHVKILRKWINLDSTKLFLK